MRLNARTFDFETTPVRVLFNGRDVTDLCTDVDTEEGWCQLIDGAEYFEDQWLTRVTRFYGDVHVVGEWGMAADDRWKS